MDSLEHVLTPRGVSHPASIAEWWRMHLADIGGFSRSIDRAVVGGAHADRLGYAFAAGYQAALHALVPSLPIEALVSLCATEPGGAHPRAIETTATRTDDGWLLRGSKRWATLSPDADVLLVVARLAGAGADERPVLRVVEVPRGASGLRVDRMPEAPFVPEIGHAQVEIDGVTVPASAMLDGDGYDRYLKPFRTIEDIHVFAAALAYVGRVATEHDWPRALREELVALLAAFRELASQDPARPGVHVALAGAIALARRWLATTDAEWGRVDASVRDRWQRDRALFNVAEKVRHQRTERAWGRAAT